MLSLQQRLIDHVSNVASESPEKEQEILGESLSENDGGRGGKTGGEDGDDSVVSNPLNLIGPKFVH